MTKTVFCIRRLSYYFGGPETYSCVNQFKRDDGTFILVGLARDCVRNSDNLVICESSFGCFLCAIYFAMLCSRGNWEQLDGRQTIERMFFTIERTFFTIERTFFTIEPAPPNPEISAFRNYFVFFEPTLHLFALSDQTGTLTTN